MEQDVERAPVHPAAAQKQSISISPRIDEKGTEMARKIEGNLWKLAIIQFFMFVDFFAAVLIPVFTDWASLTYVQMLILQSWFLLVNFIFEVPTGTFADRFGRKATLLMAGLCSTLTFAIYASKPDFWVFFIGETVGGLGMALSSGAHDAMIYDTLKVSGKEDQSKRYMGRIHAAGSLAILISGPMGSLIAVSWGIQATIQWASVFRFFGFCLTATLVEPAIEFHGKKPNAITIFRQGIAHLKQTPALKRLAFDMVIFGFLPYYAMWTYQVRLGELGLPQPYYGYVFMVMIIIEFAFLFGMQFFDKIFRKQRHALLFSATFIGVGYIGAMFTENLWVSMFAYIFLVGIGWSRPILLANYANKHTPSEQRATIISSINMIRIGFLIVLNPLMGLWMETGLRAMLLTLGIVALIALIINPIKEEDLIT